MSKTANDEKDAGTSPPKGNWLMGHLYPWLAAALRSPQAWKTWVRCMVAFFVLMVLMLVEKTLTAIGSATFFGLIAVMILPPSFPVTMNFMAQVTLMLGTLFGWAWGCAAMAAADRARSKAHTMAELQKAQQEGIPTVLAVFAARFLDTRSSTVYGVFQFFGQVFIAWVRTQRPTFALFAIFASIILDLMTTFGPLFPKPNYTIAKNLIIPAAVFMAVALACSLLIFPESQSHVTLGLLVNKGLPPLTGVLTIQEEILSTRPSDHEAWAKLADAVRLYQTQYLMTAAGLDAQKGMLQLEVSRGRISPGQLQELIKRLKDIAAKSFGLGAFVTMVQQRYEGLVAHRDNPLPHVTSLGKQRVEEGLADHEKSGNRSLEGLLPLLKETTSELRLTTATALEDASQYLTAINKSRWKKFPADLPPTSKRQENLDNLRKALAEFRKSKHFGILDQFRDMFDESGQLKQEDLPNLTNEVRGLFRCFILTSSLISYAVAVIAFLELLMVIEVSNPKSKLQFPGKFVSEAVKVANSRAAPGEADLAFRADDALADRDSIDSDHEAESDDDASSEHTRVEKPKKVKKRRNLYAKDPDAGEPRNAFQKFGRLLSAAGRGLASPNGMYCLKYGVVSIALWIPAVAPSSAKFYYENRGLWALIMAQTGMGVFTGEQVYNFVTRMWGTIVGCLIGIVVWYIGAPGKALGNPYGVAAATMVFTGPFLFIRIAAPPRDMGMWLMIGVTIVFVVGYSWCDNHIQQSANQGAGASLAARRALLVVIGFVASFIAILFPRPVSVRKVLREGFAKNIGALGQLYGMEVSALEEARNEPGVSRATLDRQRAHFLKVFGRLQQIQQRMAFAFWEPAMRGPWPKKKYEALTRAQMQMLGASALLAGSYSQLDPQWIVQITNSDMMHPGFVADCLTTFSLLRHSLRGSVPLPPMIPIFERLAYHRSGNHARMIARAALRGENKNLPVLHSTLQLASDVKPGASLRSEIALFDTVGKVLTWQNCHNEQFSLFATSLIALSHIVGGLHSMHDIVLDLVGERELDGFDAAQERWAQSQMEV